MNGKISLDEYKKIILNGLIFIRDICDKNNLNYFLYAGTLLGAVKYKGFIPWDDDIDIVLLRDDYEKLLKLLEENENEDYKVLHVGNTKDYYYPYAKLVHKKTKVIENAKEIDELGAYVDIFPLDGIADGYEKEINKMRFIWNLAARRMRIKNSEYKSSTVRFDKDNVRFRKMKDFIYIFTDYITLPLGNKFWASVLDKKLKKHNIADYNYVSRYKYNIEVFEKSLFMETAMYDFEGTQFKSIKDYNFLLTIAYGDYMKELPKERQRSHHQMEVTWRNSNE